MKISDILSQNQILPQLKATDKESALRELSHHLRSTHSDIELPANEIFAALQTREQLGSTGVGEGVAIPHAKIPGLRNLVAVFGRAPQGVTFDAIDEQPVKLIFALLVPENSAGAHLKALARISRMLKNAEFRDQLLSLAEAAPLYAAFVEEDARH